MSAIFGGSKQKSKSQQQSTSQQSSQSFNQAYPWIQQQYSGVVDQGNRALGNVSALLGLGGNKAEADSAYNDYLGSTGYTSALQRGSQAITTNRAVNGLLGSGSTLRALNSFGQETAQKYFGDYLARLLGLSATGLQAGGLIAGAGNTASSQGTSQSTGSSTGSSSSTGGLAALIGKAASTAAAG